MRMPGKFLTWLSARARMSIVAIVAVTATFVPPVGAQDDADANRPIRDKWAVIIGVSKFENPQIPVLKYPSKDAQDFADFLVSKGNFSRDHILLLTDEKATRLRILDAFGDGWLPKRVMEDDLVVIFISSHGSPADVAGENFIIAYDSDPNKPYATGIRFQDLANEVTKRTGCDRLVLLLDACHSGAAVAGQKGLLRTPSNFKLDSITGTGQLVISSSAPDEVSWESKRYANSVFTRKLIDSLSVKGKDTPISEAYKELKNSVAQEVQFDRTAKQTPMIMSKWKGQELLICAPAAEPRKVLSELPEEVPVQKRPTQVISQLPQNTTHSIPTQPVNPAPVIKPAPVVNNVTPTSTTNSKPTQMASMNAGSSLLSPPMMTSHWLDNKGDGTLESGTRIIDIKELSKLSNDQLTILLNEGFARHGRGFYMSSLQQYFNSQPWYKIDSDYHWRTDDPKVIARKGQTDDPLVINERRTPKQAANIATIKRAQELRKCGGL